MTEPLDTVYVGNLRNWRAVYHRAPSDQTWNPNQLTRCERQRLADCTTMTEVEAVAKHDPCLLCFPVRGRRQRILDQILVVGIPDA